MIEQDLKIAFNRRVAARTFLMGIWSPEMAGLSGPGQFVMIRVGPGMDPLLRRPFSIAGVEGKEIFLVLYQVVGRGTALLSQVREGDRLSVLGPLGRGFDGSTAGSDPLLIGGGVGIAPLLFLYRSLGGKGVTFMAGFGTGPDVVPVQEMGLEKGDIDLSTDDGAVGHKGMVTDLLEARLAERAGDVSTIFACGPPPMLRRVADLAFPRNIPFQVSLETAMACGVGACQGCVVKTSGKTVAYYRACREGPVFDARDVDWRSL